MMPRFVAHCLLAVVATAVAWSAGTAYAIGGNHPAGGLEAGRPQWPTRLAELTSVEERVLGYWVNQADYFFYRGDASELNAFLSQYAKIEDAPLSVVLHAGTAPRTGPLGAPQEEPFSWKLAVQRRGWGVPADPRRPEGDPGYVATVHVWLTGGITLEKLEIPAHVEVLSAHEIERFILRHRGSLAADQ